MRVGGGMQWLVGACTQSYYHRRLELRLCQIWGKEPTSPEERIFLSNTTFSSYVLNIQKSYFLKQGRVKLSAGWFVSV